MYEGRTGQTTGNAAVQPIETSSPLRDAIGQTEGQVEQLHGVISELEERLATVLMPVPPQALDKAPTPTQPMMSAVRERMVSVNGGCQHAIDRLRDIRRRVDL